jgi:hypothetical protein
VPLYTSGTAGHRVPLGSVIVSGPETPFQFLTPDVPRRILIDPQMTLLCTAE